MITKGKREKHQEDQKGADRFWQLVSFDLVSKYKRMKANKFCQSCGFPLKKYEKGGGTEKDGSLSTKYCSMCYENGVLLTPPEIDTAGKMQKYCMEEMKKKRLQLLFRLAGNKIDPETETLEKIETTIPACFSKF